jgi:hypothetical protein
VPTHTPHIPPGSTRRSTLRPTLRSTSSRAIVPVAGGIVFFAVLALLLWGVAAYLSRDGARVSERLTPTRFEVSSVESAADAVAENGPILFPGLATTTGERTIVLDHEGSDPATGWTLYFAYPAGADPSCAVEQVRGTRRFVDCTGATIDVTELSPPPTGVNPVVEGRKTLYIDLSGVNGPND